MKNRCKIDGSFLTWLVVMPAMVLLVTTGGCAKVEQKTGPGGGGTGGAGGRGASGSGGRTTQPVGDCTACKDLPADPIMDPTAPANAAGMFAGDPPTSGGPCIVEPEDNTLFPNDWLRPRVKFTGAGGKLVRITMAASNQVNVMTAYTTNDHWEVPKEVWASLRFHQTSAPVTVTVWVAGGGASQSHFKTAPVGAGGNMIFWAAKPSEVDKDLDKDCPKVNNQPVASCYEGDSELRFFAVGDEKTAPVLTIPDVTQPSKDNNNKASHVRCIGCHTGTPDGDYVAFNDAWPWRGVMAGVTADNKGRVPGYLAPGGVDDMQQPALGVMTFSRGHWSTSERLVITSNSWTPTNRMMGMAWYDAPHNPRPELMWFDLASTMVPRMGANIQGDPANPDLVFPIMGVNMGIIARTGDTRGAATPNWSHNGALIAYSSTDSHVDGHLDNIPTPNPNPYNWSHNMGHSDIYTVPFNDKKGDIAKAVAGAATTTFEEYFPSFSPDDEYIAFNRVPASQSMYANPNSEIVVVPTGGGDATALFANKPAACTNKVSPGVNNHWVKWAPEVKSGSDGKYYWVVFSSNRADIPPVTSKYGAKRQIQISQLYIAPVIIPEIGPPQSYPAIYLWNQDPTTVNTTPAWESFQLPPIP